MSHHHVDQNVSKEKRPLNAVEQLLRLSGTHILAFDTY